MLESNFEIKMDIKKKCGRPRKYKTKEEAKEAKKAYDIKYITDRRKNDKEFNQKLRDKAKKSYARKKLDKLKKIN